MVAAARKRLPSLKRLGKYKIVGRLGAGGMSRVYKAVKDGEDVVIALKVTPVENDIDVTVLDYQREVMMGRRVKHPSIVSPIDHGCRDGYIYLTMPIVEGATLSNATRLRDPSRKPSSSRSSAYNDAWCVPLLEKQWSNIAQIGVQLSSALATCHSAGVIHRDIKPGNVILTREGKAHLMDFGLSWMRLGPADHELETRAGTARYLPPEVFQDKRDERSDIYSLGLTLHELATGLKVWGEVDHETIKETRPDFQVPPIHSIRDDVPAPLAACLDRASADHPDDRHQTAQELLADLERVQRVLTSKTSEILCELDDLLTQMNDFCGRSGGADPKLTEDVWFSA